MTRTSVLQMAFIFVLLSNACEHSKDLNYSGATSEDSYYDYVTVEKSRARAEFEPMPPPPPPPILR